MKARHHVLAGSIAASAMVPVLGVNSIFFLVASIFIDGDHYIDYTFRNNFKDFSIKSMFRFYDLLFETLEKEGKSQCFLTLCIMHTIEGLGIFYILSEFTGWLWLKAVFWGISFHLISDMTYTLLNKRRIFGRALSIIEYVIRWNIKKRHGCQPQQIYNKVLALLYNESNNSLEKHIFGSNH